MNDSTQIGREQLENLLIKVCDSISGLSSHKWGTKNLRNRPVLTNHISDHGYTIGTALTGYRSAAIVDKGLKIRGYVKTALRQNLPIVFHLFGPSNPAFGTGRAIQLKSSNLQEMYDMALLSHVIAERSMLPVVHHIQIGTSPAEELAQFSDIELSNFLGSSDDIITCPTPAQGILFGSKRRRIPQWHNLDVPMGIGIKKNGRYQYLEKAARRAYFYSHIEEIIDSSFEDFEDITKRRYSFFKEHNLKKCKSLILCVDGQFNELTAVFAGNKKVGIAEPAVYIGKTQASVQPEKGLDHLIVINSLKAPQMQIDWLVSLQNQNKKLTRVSFADNWKPEYSEEIGIRLTNDSLTESLDLGIQYYGKTIFPNHQATNQQVERGYPDLQDRSYQATTDSAESFSKRDVPALARNLNYSDLPAASLTSFNDNIGVFARSDHQEEIKADPFQAVPLTPAATSILSEPSTDLVPIIDTEDCSGCGKCLIHCPYAALPSGLFTTEDMVKSFSEIASKEGKPLKGMIPYVKNWGKAISKHIREHNHRNLILAEAFEAGFNILMAQVKPGDTTEKELWGELEPIITVFGNTECVLTETFFTLPEKIEKGSGALFILAPDNDVCTGCSICQKVCPEQAIQMTSIQSDEAVENDQSLKVLNQLPATSAEWMNRLLEEENFPSLSTLALNRKFYNTAIGGKANSKHSFKRSIFHTVEMVLESILTPRKEVYNQTLDLLSEKLAGKIHKDVSDHIPNLDSQNVETSESQKGVESGKIIDKLTHLSLRDNEKKRLQQQLLVLKELNKLKGLLQKGYSGQGRSSYGLIIDEADSDWAAEYPSNPFLVPNVFVWHQGISSVADGLFKGHIEHFLKNLRLIRRAQLEVTGTYSPHEHDQQLLDISWEDLTDDEKSIAPPLIVVGTEKLLTSSLWKELSRVLSTNFPIKVIVLDSMDHTPGDTLAISRSNAEIISLMTMGSSFVYQGGLHEGEGYFDGLVEGLRSTNPAFYRLFAPDYDTKQLSMADLEMLSKVAGSSRAYPSIKYQPAGKESFFKDCLSLSGNDEFEQDFVFQEIIDNDETIRFGLTWADWAFTNPSYTDFFTKVEKEQSYIAVSDYIKAIDRESFTPVIFRVEDKTVVRYTVNESIIAMAEASLRSWNVLQELGGIITKYPEKLREQIAKVVEREYEAKLDVSKQEFERKLADVERDQKDKLKSQLKNKLVQLANARN